MYRIRKTFKFEGSHILKTAFSKACSEHIHGHSYKVEVMLESQTLNEDGMVIDFGKVKEVIKPEIDKWDHAFVCHETDERYNDVADFTVPFNPTAENMAKYFYDKFRKPLNGSVSCVRIHETDTGWAEYDEVWHGPRS